MIIEVKKFPTDTERLRISTLRKFEKLYDNEQYAVLGLHKIIKSQFSKEEDIVYLGHALPARISDFYGDFVAGETEKMVIKANSEDEAVTKFIDDTIFNNDLKEKVNDFATGQSEFGFTVLHSWLDDEGIYHIESVPQDQYFPQVDGSVIFVTYKQDPATTDKKLIALTEHYSLVGEDCKIERKAWRADEKGILTETYSLETMANLVGRTLLPEETLSGLNDLPIRQVDNGKKTKYGFGKSDYVDIVPQLAEVNERATHIATQLLKNLDAKLQLPAEMANEDGKVDAFETVLVESKDSAEAKYITNTNPLIADAENHILRELKFISFSTAVPMFQLLKGSMPERVESLRIQLFEAIRRTNKKRAKIVRGLNDMFRIGFKMKGIDYKDDLIWKFTDVIPVDEQIQTDTEAAKVGAGLSSKRSAIMRLEGVDAQEAEAEMEQINQENQLAGIGDMNNPPALV